MQSRTASQAGPRVIKVLSISIDALRDWDLRVDRMTRSGDLRLLDAHDDTMMRGRHHERFAQLYRGVPVWGGGLTRIVFAETYPFDTVTFTSATTERAEKTKLGFNVGADVGYRLSHSVGIGALVRYSRASLSLPLTGSASDVSVDAGGLQVGGGVRFYF